ncbi:MAG: hypothetical protein GY784_17405 [Gammaproteobacteria bacterium]|nr:hypothetical protein [Gammaproteobacteria bacterium]
MRIPSYIQRNRYGIFYFRRAVPHALRSAVGKREIIFSLHTREPQKAVKFARISAIQVDQIFSEARMGKTIKTGWTFEVETTPDGVTKTRQASL